MFAVAGNGARVADGCWGVLLGGRGRRWIAGEAGIEALSERTKVTSAGVELLLLSVDAHARMLFYVRMGEPRVLLPPG